MANDSVVEEVRSRLDIVQLISEYLRLQKAGVRFRAPCPFHNEKDPSFYVSPDRQRWHCFGCNEDGDAFEFVMKMEGMTFPEALRHLAGKAGVELPEYKADPARKEKMDADERLHEANRQAALFWHQVLLKHPAASRAMEYIKKRELEDSTVDEFLIGYAPESWDATSAALKKKGFTDKELIEAGLSSVSQRSGKLFDRFRNRLTIPIRDERGRHVGFSGRIMPGPDGKDPEGEAKYINTPQTEIYNKGKTLFGFDLARKAIQAENQAVIVEGNMDVIASHQAGVKNVVATSGTALSEGQWNFTGFRYRLPKICRRIVLAMDSDEAGQKAIRHIHGLINNGDFDEVRILRLPPDAGKDPDDAIRKDPEIWKSAIRDAVPYMKWLISVYRDRTDLDDTYSKNRAYKDLLSEVRQIKDTMEMSDRVHEIAEWLRLDEKTVMDDLGKMPTEMPSGQKTSGRTGVDVSKSQSANKLDRHGLVSEFLAGIAVAWPELSDRIVSHVLPDEFDEATKPLYTSLVLHYNEARIGSQYSDSDRPAAFRPGDDQTGQRLTVLELQAEKEFGGLKTEERAAVTDRLVAEIKQLHTDRLRRHLAAEMAKAERDDNSARVAEIQRQLDELI